MMVRCCTVGFHRAVILVRRFDAVRRDEGRVLLRRKRETGRRDFFTGFLLLGAGVVECEVVGEDYLAETLLRSAPLWR